jgi:hypothetical protein
VHSRRARIGKIHGEPDLICGLSLLFMINVLQAMAIKSLKGRNRRLGPTERLEGAQKENRA